MQRRPPWNRSESGIALVLAIVITGVCLAIVFSLMNYVIGNYKAQHMDWKRVQALYCAEAGMEQAANALAANPNTTSVPETQLSTLCPGAAGSFTATISPLGDPQGSVKITATGYYPNQAACAANIKESISRTIRGIYCAKRTTFDFGTDAVRSRNGVRFGSNYSLTVVVDNSGNMIWDPATNASIRVTGDSTGNGSVSPTTGSVRAFVAGSVTAPGSVTVGSTGNDPSGNPYPISSNPSNWIPNAFPDNASIGFDNLGNLVWPPTGNTIVSQYYQDALAGGTITSVAAGGTITGPKFIDLGGTGTLQNVTLQGPGTIVVRGNLGDGVVNGPPPCQLVVTGNFAGNVSYHAHPAAGTQTCPPLVVLGSQCEIRGSATWDLHGALLALNPNVDVQINDSAVTLLGAVISNGTVYYKSAYGGLGYPKSMANAHVTLQGSLPPAVVSYTVSE